MALSYAKIDGNTISSGSSNEMRLAIACASGKHCVSTRGTVPDELPWRALQPSPFKSKREKNRDSYPGNRNVTIHPKGHVDRCIWALSSRRIVLPNQSLC